MPDIRSGKAYNPNPNKHSHLWGGFYHASQIQIFQDSQVHFSWDLADTGPSFKHHGKTGTNRSVITEGNGVPIGLVIASANTNDFKLAQSTLESIPIPRPEPTAQNPQNMSLDKGYDYPEVDELVDAWGYTGHIRRKGEQPIIPETVPKYRARRWVVERTHAWMNNFRRLLIRWEKKTENYLALLHFVCAWITFRAVGLF